MKLGVIVIGQSPRPDLVDPLRAMLPKDEILEIGALDDTDLGGVSDPTRMRYPLMTLLRDGSRVVVDESELTPLLQRALERLEGQGAAVSLLACAGPFAEVRGLTPLVRPFVVASSTLHSLGIQHIGVVCPSQAQKDPCFRKWTEAGFHSTVWAPDEGESHQPSAYRVAGRMSREIECVVLDYVGYSSGYRQAIWSATGLPTLDVGHLAISAIASSVNPLLFIAAKSEAIL